MLVRVINVLSIFEGIFFMDIDVGRSVFVVGAGASKEFGLPTGEELKSKIADIVDIRFDARGSRIISGNPRLVEVLRLMEKSKSATSTTINEYLHVGWNIRDNMQLAPSIDNFLDTHSSNDRLVEFGKLAIVSAILDAESSSMLNVEEYARSGRRLDFENLKGTWLFNLFQILVSQRNFEGFLEALDRMTFVSFNYDRCIHQFLTVAAKQYFNLDQAQTEKILEHLDVIYPYGTVGEPIVGQLGIHGFGSPVHGENLIQRAQSIKTFTEGIADTHEKVVQEAFQNAGTIMFLGFGYLPLNMKLMFGQERVNTGRVMGSVYNVPQSSVDHLRDELKAIFGRKYSGPTWQAIGDLNLHLKNQTCGELVYEFNRHLSSH